MWPFDDVLCNSSTMIADRISLNQIPDDGSCYYVMLLYVYMLIRIYFWVGNNKTTTSFIIMLHPADALWSSVGFTMRPTANSQRNDLSGHMNTVHSLAAMAENHSINDHFVSDG